MGKKKTGGGPGGLGRCLIKERLQANRGHKKIDTWVRIKAMARYTMVSRQPICCSGSIWWFNVMNLFALNIAMHKKYLA